MRHEPGRERRERGGSARATAAALLVAFAASGSAAAAGSASAAPAAEGAGAASCVVAQQCLISPTVTSRGGAAPTSPAGRCKAAAPPLAIAEPERDLTEVEAIVGAIKEVSMGGVCKALTAFDLEAARPHLAPGFRGQRLFPRAETPVVAGAGTRGVLVRPADAGCFGGADELVADLGRLTGSWQRVERCFFKPYRVFATPRGAAGPRRAAVDLHLWLGGATAAGRREGEKGDVAAEMVEDAEGRWRFSRLTWGERERFEADGRAFADWTERAGLPRDWRDDGYDPTDFTHGQVLYGGVAMGDYDRDGWSDLYVVRAGANALLRNDGRGGFEDVTERTGVGDPGNGQGALWVDLDNDGDLDLFVVNAAYDLIKSEHAPRGHVLYRNDGARGAATTFTRLPFALGPIGPASGATAADYDGDGLLDLYVTYYQDAKLHPYHHFVEARDGFGNRLFRNLGGWRFADVTDRAGVRGGGWAYAAAWADYDEDGWIDLFIANDFGDDQLFRSRGRNAAGEVAFEEVAARAGVADPANGMSADWGDYDNDGRLDLYVGNMYSKTGNQFVPLVPDLDPVLRQKLLWSARGNSLYRNAGRDASGQVRFEEKGSTAAVHLAGWSWGSNFLDYDNDGRLDIHVVNGFWAGTSDDDA